MLQQACSSEVFWECKSSRCHSQLEVFPKHFVERVLWFTHAIRRPISVMRSIAAQTSVVSMGWEKERSRRRKGYRSIFVFSSPQVGYGESDDQGCHYLRRWKSKLSQEMSKHKCIGSVERQKSSKWIVHMSHEFGISSRIRRIRRSTTSHQMTCI